MSGNYFVNFHQGEGGALLLPPQCEVKIACSQLEGVQQALVSAIEESLYALALSGMDLRALDGVTIALDARQAACALQDLPDGLTPLEMTDHPEVMELARTVAVKRGDDFRFHIVLRSGLALMALSSEPVQQALAGGCIAHEAAHVEHEGHLYRTFPQMYGRALECGNRSRQTFLKALDVWSEYAACRSSAQFRPEALEDFDGVFCRALGESRCKAEKWIANYRDGGQAAEAFREIQQAFGDTFICAGYLIGHLHGLELRIASDAPGTRQLLSENPHEGELITELGRVLNGLWLSEFAWTSLDVFAPIYDLICELMALHGMAFARHGDEWRVIMSDDERKTPALKDFLMSKAKESNP